MAWDNGGRREKASNWHGKPAETGGNGGKWGKARKLLLPTLCHSSLERGHMLTVMNIQDSEAFWFSTLTLISQQPKRKMFFALQLPPLHNPSHTCTHQDSHPTQKRGTGRASGEVPEHARP